jgi:hypothetical protein
MISYLLSCENDNQQNISVSAATELCICTYVYTLEVEDAKVSRCLITKAMI